MIKKSKIKRDNKGQRLCYICDKLAVPYYYGEYGIDLNYFCSLEHLLQWFDNVEYRSRKVRFTKSDVNEAGHCLNCGESLWNRVIGYYFESNRNGLRDRFGDFCKRVCMREWIIKLIEEENDSVNVSE